MKGPFDCTAQEMHDAQSTKCNKAAIHSSGMEAEKLHVSKYLPQTGEELYPVHLLALDPVLIDYLADTRVYSLKVFTRSLGGPKSIVVSLTDSRRQLALHLTRQYWIASLTSRQIS